MTDRNDNYFDCLVLIGRFQPFHNGHVQVIRAGLERTAMLIVVCGSARQPRSVRNPWDEWERERMIRGSLTGAENNRVHIAPLMDNPYDGPAWRREVEQAVNALATAISGGHTDAARIALIGHDLHHSGYYPKQFPQWEHIEVPDHRGINGTAIRDKLFAGKDPTAAIGYLHSEPAAAELPAQVIVALEQFCNSRAFSVVQAEYDYIARYRQSWSSAPYPPIFVTVDNVITHGNHILLIERKDYPGKGLLALPGGFVNEYEALADACMRELQEETSLDVPVATLKNAIRKKAVFDYPYRSARGRIITHVFHIALDPARTLPDVQGGDDARQARWLPLAGLDPAGMLEDHFFIIRKMLAG